jgi:hypothetical protein
LKRKLTPQEKEAVMNRVIDNKVMLDVWGRDPEKSISVLSADDLSKAYVVVGNTEVKLNSIPAQSRAAITRQLRAAGMPVTEQAIAEVWVESRRRGDPNSLVNQIPQ